MSEAENYNNVIYPDVKNEYPAKLVDYLIKRFDLRSGPVLDVGCGKGTFVKLFMERRYSTSEPGMAWGIDKRIDAKTAVTVRNKNYVELGLIKQCDVERDEFPINSNNISFVFSKSLIEHVNDPELMIMQIKRVLNKGGRVVIMTPSWETQMNHFWDDHTHVHPYTRKSLMNLLKIYGFNEVTCEEFYQLPFMWKYPWAQFIPDFFKLFPDSWKWKDGNMRNGSDRKLIRFSKETMLLATGVK
jgi:SAM-dependent methyltransferase